MATLIQDRYGNTYQLSDAPRGAAGAADGAFVDAQSAAQFLHRFVDAPEAMETLRRVLLDEGLPSDRLDDDAVVRRLAGQLAARGLRLVRPSGDEDIEAPSVKGADPAAAAEDPGAEDAEEERPEKKKTLTARWSPLEAYCADQVNLLGTATNMDPGTAATGQGAVAKQGNVASLKGTGHNSFTLQWRVKDVVFSGKSLPPNKQVQGKLSAGGLTATAPQPLSVKRVPDRAAAPISFARAAGKYSWTAAFRLGVKDDVLQVDQTLQITPAWLGKWVSFDKDEDGREGWGFVKKDAATWMFWDTAASPPAWTALPRGISENTVNNLIFIKQGAEYVARDQATFKWPEAFAAPAGYAEKKAAWLANIHQVWDDKFSLKHKECVSGAAACCSWRIRVKVQWSDGAGDKQVYAVSAQEWERSNAKDWYLTEHRVGVAAHECGHLLGAYDEYEGGAVDPATNKIEDASVMGSDLATPHARHLDGLRDEAKKLINAAIGRSWTFEVK